MAQNPPLLSAWKPSGVVSPVVVAAPVAGLIAALPLAALCALINIYVPIVGIVTLLALGGFALVHGVVVGGVLGGGRSRNRVVTIVLALASALGGLYALWALFLYFFLRRVDQDPSLIAMFLSPDAMWSVMSAIAEQGWFSVKGATPSGALLWIFWIGEAVVFLGVSLVTAIGAADVVWCEACNVATTGAGAVQMADGSGLAEAARQGSARRLDQLPAVIEPGLTPTERLTAHQCPRCTFTVVEVDRLTRTLNDKGEIEVSTSSLLPRHVVPRDFMTRAQQVAAQAERDAQAPATAPAPEGVTTDAQQSG